VGGGGQPTTEAPLEVAIDWGRDWRRVCPGARGGGWRRIRPKGKHQGVTGHGPMLQDVATRL